MFIICESWLFEKNGSFFCYYPACRTPELLVKNMARISSNWKTYEVIVLKRNIVTYKLAVQSLQTRKRYDDTESEMENKQKRLRLTETDSNNQMNLNNLFDKMESSEDYLGRQNSSGILLQTIGSKDLINNPSNISDSTTVYVTQPLTDELIERNDTYMEVLNETQCFAIEERIGKLEMEIAEVKSVQKKQIQLSTQLNQKLDLILEILQRNLQEPQSNKNNPDNDDDIFVTLPIESTQQIDFVEHKLSLFDKQANFDPEFKKQRCKLVRYLSKRIVNDKAKGEPKNGLAISLLKLYFSSDFFLSDVGWSNYEGRVEICNYPGHISLFSDVINAHTEGIYTNLDAAKKCIHYAIRIIHEDRNKILRKMRKANSNSNEKD